MNIEITALFLILVLLVVLTSVRLWLAIWFKRKPAVLREDSYLRLSEVATPARPLLSES